jgi:hypothetical protein
MPTPMMRTRFGSQRNLQANQARAMPSRKSVRLHKQFDSRPVEAHTCGLETAGCARENRTASGSAHWPLSDRPLRKSEDAKAPVGFYNVAEVNRPGVGESYDRRGVKALTDDKARRVGRGRKVGEHPALELMLVRPFLRSASASPKSGRRSAQASFVPRATFSAPQRFQQLDAPICAE